jgi:hypothetical protein
MDLKEIRYEAANRIHLFQDRVKWWVLVKTVTNLRNHREEGSFLASWVANKFSRRQLFHGVSYNWISPRTYTTLPAVVPSLKRMFSSLRSTDHKQHNPYMKKITPNLTQFEFVGVVGYFWTIPSKEHGMSILPFSLELHIAFICCKVNDDVDIWRSIRCGS